MSNAQQHIVRLLVCALGAAASFAVVDPGRAQREPEPAFSAHGTSMLSDLPDLGERRGVKALPYRAPERTPHARDKLVIAHYHPFYPLSKDDEPASGDAYTTRYLNVLGEGGRHVAYGGYLRDRPLPREPRGTSYQIKDMRTEVRRAVAAGLDGFSVNLIGTHGSSSDSRLSLLLEAAADISPAFSITLMPDLYPAQVPVPTPTEMAEYLATVGRHPNVHRTEQGRLVVAPFGADREGAAYWTQVLVLMRQLYGEDPFFVPCLLDYWRSAPSMAPISDGLSAWGYRNVGADESNDVAGMARDAHARGKLWMHPVAYGDSRPSKATYNESANTSLLRHTFTTASKESAEWVQVITWNDYAENTFVSPSPSIGWAVLDLVSYYADAFRSGHAPHITRDVGYLSYRRQFHTTPGSLQPVSPTARAGTAPRDQIEALAFLRKPARLIIRVGETLKKRRVGAGVKVLRAPLDVGVPSLVVKRAGRTVARVTGIFPVVSAPEVFTANYYIVSSGRTGR